MRQVSVIIADDHSIVRDGLRDVLADVDARHGLAFEIVNEASNGLEALAAVKAHKPELLLLDLAMPLATGAEILADVKRWSPDTRIAIFTGVVAPGLLASLVESGVHGMFSKAVSTDDICDHLALILNGGYYVAPDLAEVIEQGHQAASLTDRERQTLNMIISGKSNKEMARLLNISPKTVEKHRTSLMQKLEVHSIAELLARALKDGLIAPDAR